jgi:signal transduction histidine kinase
MDLIQFPHVRVYRPMIMRALFNIFSNAIKYSFHSSKDASRERYIRVVTRRRYSTNPLSFSITLESFGVGFSSLEELRHAAEFGFRGSLAVLERPIGSGIGLAEVRRIMKMHGGILQIRSEPIGRSPALTKVALIFRVPSGL